MTFSTSGTLDTDLDSNCNGGVVMQDAAPPICVLRYGTISITDQSTLSIMGSRVVAFVADGKLDIAGTLDVSANVTVNGPGGGFVISGGGEVCVNGGGGAGFKTAGGSGGDAMTDGGAGNGGAISLDPALLTSLVGGTRAMPLAPDTPTSGGGGGGLTLISCRGDVTVEGTIDAGGGGGRSGFVVPFPGCAVGATGGGSGGNVVIQALSINVTGGVFANGGGGGSGRPTDNNTGSNGFDGTRDVLGASGGLPQGPGAGAGGIGGTGTAGPTDGKQSTDPAASGGGGGGSVGFLQTYTPEGVTPILTPAASSPSFQPNLNATLR